MRKTLKNKKVIDTLDKFPPRNRVISNLVSAGKITRSFLRTIRKPPPSLCYVRCLAWLVSCAVERGFCNVEVHAELELQQKFSVF